MTTATVALRTMATVRTAVVSATLARTAFVAVRVAFAALGRVAVVGHAALALVLTGQVEVVLEGQDGLFGDRRSLDVRCIRISVRVGTAAAGLTRALSLSLTAASAAPTTPSAPPAATTAVRLAPVDAGIVPVPTTAAGRVTGTRVAIATRLRARISVGARFAPQVTVRA